MRYQPGMFVYALAFLFGVVSVQQLAALADTFSLSALFVCACLCMYGGILIIRYKQPAFRREYTLIICFILMYIIGIMYSSLYAKQHLRYRLEEAMTGVNILVTGYVSDIPMTAGEVQRFEFVIDRYRLAGTYNSDETHHTFPRKLRLSWHYGERVKAGESWQFEVRLKPPHGFMNPGGFDYEGWLFQHGIHATGYVRKSVHNRVLERDYSGGLTAAINRIRQSVSEQIDAVACSQLNNCHSEVADSGSYALVKALAIGYKSSISGPQWQVLINTGTSHLMAISGLHIGLASLFGFAVIRRLAPGRIIKRVPAQHIAVIGGMTVAIVYALIAGLAVSTQRATIMLCTIALMLLMRRNSRPVDIMGFALLLVLLIDPPAVLSAGFWFSFSAVAVIYMSLHAAVDDAVLKDHDRPGAAGGEKSRPYRPANAVRSRLLKIAIQWLRLQLLISVFLLPLSLFMFQQASLVSPLANLLLIPYVSFLVVPLVLLALIANLLFPGIAEIFFIIAASLLDFVWPLLSYIASLPFALWVQGKVGIFSLCSATLGIVLLFYSRRIVSLAGNKINGARQRLALHLLLLAMAALLVLPIFINLQPGLNNGEYQLAILDVGQGSAAVLLTQNHQLVFDTGAKFSERLDAGSSVILPYIRGNGHAAIDFLIISHGDADHIGGAEAILDAYPDTAVIGQDIDSLQATMKFRCYEGINWQWDGVTFAFLSPAPDDKSLTSATKRNNHSCVLLVSSVAGTVLFTGDIEARIEQQLLQKYGEKLRADVLLVPHHGSKTSSSRDFIDMIDPKISVFSTGYNNRYRFPHGVVVRRYELLDSQLLQTDKTGAITIRFTADDGTQIDSYRDRARKYWHHDHRAGGD